MHAYILNCVVVKLLLRKKLYITRIIFSSPKFIHYINDKTNSFSYQGINKTKQKLNSTVINGLTSCNNVKYCKNFYMLKLN